MSSSVSPELATQVSQACPQFCRALTEEEVSRFVTYTHLVTLEGATVLADIGDVSDRFYLIISGVIRLMAPRDNNLIQVGQLLPGSLVGEMSFFDNEPRSIQLVAGSQPVQLLELDRAHYNRLRIEEPYICTNLLEFVVRSLDGLIRDLSNQTADLLKHVMPDH